MGAGYPSTPRNTPTRRLERARYDADTIHAILDEALVCHVGFLVDGEPRILPTLHVRDGRALYLHASTGSRMALAARSGGLPVCVAVTLLDGLVLARSQPHHSVTYRSVIVHGHAHLVHDATRKREVLTALIDKIAPGRAADTRPPTDKELAQTAVLAIPLIEVSAKVRGPQVADEPQDLTLPFWAGVLPLRQVADDPIPVTQDIPLPEYLIDYHRGATPPRSPWLTAAPLEGRHVRLEPLSMRHVDDLFTVSRDPEVWRYLPIPQPRTRTEMATVVAQALRDAARGERVTWAQVAVDSNTAVGMASYSEINPRHRSIGIGPTWVGGSWRHTEIATEATRLLLTRAFDDLGAVRVVWHTDIHDERSQRAIEHLGATREGILRAHRIRPDGSLQDTVQYAMTADDWPTARQRVPLHPAVV